MSRRATLAFPANKPLRESIRAVACALAVGCAATAAGDTIRHANGQVFEGVIISESDDRVVVRLAGGELSLSRASIQSIERSGNAANAILGVDAAFRTGSALAGLRALREAREASTPSEEINSALQRNAVALTTALGALAGNDVTEARHQLRELQDADYITTASQLVLARGFVHIDAPLDASESLRRAGADALRTDPTAHTWATDFLRRLVRELVTAGQFQDAVEQIERLRLVDEDTATTQKPLVILAKAARAREAQRYDEALRVIAEELFPESPEIARNRAATTLRLMTAWAEAEQREPDARRWNRRWAARLVPLESTITNGRLYATEANRLLRASHPAEALELLSEVPEESRPEELTHLGNLAKFESDRIAIGESDPMALLELAQWGSGNGLKNEALALLVRLRANPTLRDIADEQASTIKRERDLDILTRAVDAYDKGLLADVVAICNELDLDPGRESPNQKEILDLAQLARKEMILDEKRRPYQAEALYQEAERAFFMHRLDESWNLIDVILRHFPDTPAARRAAAILPDVARQLELQLLERTRFTMPSIDSEAVSSSVLQKTELLDVEIRRLLEENAK